MWVFGQTRPHFKTHWRVEPIAQSSSSDSLHRSCTTSMSDICSHQRLKWATEYLLYSFIKASLHVDAARSILLECVQLENSPDDLISTFLLFISDSFDFLRRLSLSASETSIVHLYRFQSVSLPTKFLTWRYSVILDGFSVPKMFERQLQSKRLQQFHLACIVHWQVLGISKAILKQFAPSNVANSWIWIALRYYRINPNPSFLGMPADGIDNHSRSWVIPSRTR